MSRPRRRDAVLVFVVALVTRLAIVAWGHARFPPAQDGQFYDLLARRLEAGEGYTWLWPDGAVTPVAHYPVGYPALLAVAYGLLGASAGVAMTLNAVLGAAGAYCAHRLTDGMDVARWRPVGAGIVVALHPSLLVYTAAVMTEGVTAALLLIAAAAASRAREAPRAWGWVASAGIAMGVATLVRPPSLLLAPVLGALASTGAARSRLARAAVVSAVAIALVLPWTARNCAKMHSCALVSLNAGWNLLIGTQTTSGTWEPMSVPSDCATVWEEAAKDSCFRRAALLKIAHDPGLWLSLAPAKIGATFDSFAAAPGYLHASNPRRFDEATRSMLTAVETVWCRVLLLAALLACAAAPGACAIARWFIVLGGAVAAITTHGWIGYVALVACVALTGARAVARAPICVPFGAAIIATTACVHAVFFGAGRYGLVAAPFVALLAFAATSSFPRLFRRSLSRP